MMPMPVDEARDVLPFFASPPRRNASAVDDVPGALSRDGRSPLHVTPCPDLIRIDFARREFDVRRIGRRLGMIASWKRPRKVTAPVSPSGPTGVCSARTLPL